MMAFDTAALVQQMTQALTHGDRRGFRSAMAQLVSTNADLRHNWRKLVEPLIGYGEFDLAIAAIDRHVVWARATPAALLDQATTYARTGRHARAAAILERIGPESTDRESQTFLRGALALNLGDFAGAREWMLETLRIRPLSGQAAYALAASASMATDADVAEHLLRGEAALDQAPREERAMYLYALGKIHADRGDPDRAFDRYARGAAEVATIRRYDASADRISAAEATQGWSRAVLAAISGRVSVPTDRPIVVTGMPRSGSTLVEQILVSHSDVSEGDELGYFAMLVNDLGSATAERATRLAQTSRPDEFVRDYLHLLDNRFGKTGRVVDKTLEATRYLGTLAALLPNTPILYVRRQPLAQAWSCFSTYFMSDLAWTFDQRAIAAHFRLEDHLLDRWQEILGERLQIVDYEALVSDKAVQIPRLLAHAGLTPEPQTQTPEMTRRLVRTASVAQVRAPITTARVDAAEAYRTHLRPFIDAYRAAGGTID
ncbi:hypothetical protein ASE86_02745 [Sphingomonas sp. Leaf33]|uniref:tetratricopeptide repeat-containing sulfotransferase family protein n=1 Tax=Sphingomonas sp. Leaf33 TaxID=1736215 RepID=UPI0006F26CF5|nr:sulfotransferase [Sphingomonas sp. Leaf33]KQN25193.1 hypothetical protein ASE86_02745 [Sphingomonas sp. Leaf33]